MNLCDYMMSRFIEKKKTEIFEMRVCCTYVTKKSIEKEEKREMSNGEIKREITTMERKFLPRWSAAQKREGAWPGCMGERER